MPGATSSVLATSSTALGTSSDVHPNRGPSNIECLQALLAALRRVTWAPEQLVGQL